MRKIKKIQPTKKWSSEEIAKIGNDLVEWQRSLQENIFRNDYLFTVLNIHPQDVEYFKQTNEEFKNSWEQAKAIELAKLLKFGVADRLNSTLVKQILINKHEWL